MNSLDDRALILDMLDYEYGLSMSVLRRVWSDKVRSEAFVKTVAVLVDEGVVCVDVGGRLFKKVPPKS